MLHLSTEIKPDASPSLLAINFLHLYADSKLSFQSSVSCHSSCPSLYLSKCTIFSLRYGDKEKAEGSYDRGLQNHEDSR